MSYGGRLLLEDCTFQNILLRRNPPKLVSTSLNDDLVCKEPFDDSFKYNADDDDAYDIQPTMLDPEDASKGSYVASGTLSDCLRPADACDTAPWVFSYSFARRVLEEFVADLQLLSNCFAPGKRFAHRQPLDSLDRHACMHPISALWGIMHHSKP